MEKYAEVNILTLRQKTKVIILRAYLDGARQKDAYNL